MHEESNPAGRLIVGPWPGSGTRRSLAPARKARTRGQHSSRLRRCRQVVKLSVDELAAQLGVTSDEVKAWERGTERPNPEQFAALSELHGISVVWLACEEG